MKIIYILAVTSCFILAESKDFEFSQYINDLYEEMGTIKQKYMSEELKNPLQPFQELASNFITKKPMRFIKINEFLSQNKDLFGIGTNVKELNNLSRNFPFIYGNYIPYYKAYFSKDKKTICEAEEKRLLEDTTLFFLHLFINTRLVPELYENTENKALDLNGFFILSFKDNPKRKVNLASFKNNLRMLMIQLLDEKIHSLLIKKAALTNYLYEILKPYFPNSVLYNTEKQFDLFNGYVKSNLVTSKIHRVLSDQIDNIAPGFQEVIKWSDVNEIKNLIISYIKADKPGYIFKKDDIPETPKEQLTWAGYLKRLMW